MKPQSKSVKTLRLEVETLRLAIDSILRGFGDRISKLENSIESIEASIVMDSSILQTLGVKITALEKPVKEVKHHYPLTHKTGAGGIYEVVCLCGEVTSYKVPLKTIDDFECSKERK